MPNTNAKSLKLAVKMTGEVCLWINNGDFWSNTAKSTSSGLRPGPRWGSSQRSFNSLALGEGSMSFPQRTAPPLSALLAPGLAWESPLLMHTALTTGNQWRNMSISHSKCRVRDYGCWSGCRSSELDNEDEVCDQQPKNLQCYTVVIYSITR